MTSAEIPNDLLQKIKSAGSKDRRKIVTIVGPPASGKSTISDVLCKQIGASAIVVPMDGFHLDNSILDKMNMRHRKGAPESFDVAGLCDLVQRITSHGHVYFPIFDRAKDIAIAQGGEVTKEHDLVFLEGNYLLLDEPRWRDISDHSDLSVFLDIPRNIVEQRLIKRWRDYGLDQVSVDRKVYENDLPNFDRIVNRSLPSDYRMPLTDQVH